MLWTSTSIVGSSMARTRICWCHILGEGCRSTELSAWAANGTGQGFQLGGMHCAQTQACRTSDWCKGWSPRLGLDCWVPAFQRVCLVGCPAFRLPWRSTLKRGRRTAALQFRLPLRDRGSVEAVQGGRFRAATTPARIGRAEPTRSIMRRPKTSCPAVRSA